jgi:hypothetical protein
MNALMRNKDSGEFYLIGVHMTPSGEYEVVSRYLHPDGSTRVKGGSTVCLTQDSAIKRVRSMIRMKKKKRLKEKRCFAEVDLRTLPEKALKYLQANLDEYIPPEEMQRLVEEAILERYVEFECAVGLEDRFDEGVEYLAIKDVEDEGFYYVYDRNGEQCHCHESRFSRLEPTERAQEVGARTGVGV